LPIGRGEVTEDALEPRGRADDEQPSLARDNSPLSVRNAAGQEDGLPRSEPNRLAAAPNGVFAFQDVKELSSFACTCNGVSRSDGTSSKTVSAPAVVSALALTTTVSSP
jgi:hypothetical protein